MLHMQGSFGRTSVWQSPGAQPYRLRMSLRRHGLIPALVAASLAWIAIAQIVQTRQTQAGVLMHLALVVVAAAGMVANARQRRVRDAEAAGVAHDLRGPLITLQATLELLAGDGFGSLPEPARAAALRAAATSGRATDVVERLLRRSADDDASRPLHGLTDLDVVLHETIDALDVQVRAAGATVRIAAMPHVAADSCALFRVFVNLIQNGLKYHRPGAHPVIVVSAEVEGQWAIVSVSDNGIGIAPAERGRVFERNYRTAAGAAQASGEGLGLDTVARLVSRMGGTVCVDPATVRGTTVHLRLPLA
jgi:signal transduction histidine kinase